METQPIYLSSDESEINSPPSSPVPQPPDNIPDTYGAITQLIAAQHHQMSLSGSSAPQCPITPRPTSLISDDEDNEMLTPIGGNRAQFLTYTLDHRSIPDTPESPTPENRGHADHLHTDAILQPSLIPLNNPPQYHHTRRRPRRYDFAPPSTAQRMGDRVLGMRQIVWPSHRGDCGRLSTQHGATRRNSPGETKKAKCVHGRHPEQRLHFSPPGSVAGCRL